MTVASSARGFLAIWRGHREDNLQPGEVRVPDVLHRAGPPARGPRAGGHVEVGTEDTGRRDDQVRARGPPREGGRQGDARKEEGRQARSRRHATRRHRRRERGGRVETPVPLRQVHEAARSGATKDVLRRVQRQRLREMPGHGLLRLSQRRGAGLQEARRSAWLEEVQVHLVRERGPRQRSLPARPSDGHRVEEPPEEAPSKGAEAQDRGGRDVGLGHPCRHQEIRTPDLRVHDARGDKRGASGVQRGRR